MELKVIAAEHIVATGNKDGRWTNVYVTPLADAQATVEALQRVRDEFERERDQLHAALMEAKAALDAEREKVKGLHEITKAICTHCCEPMEIPSKAVLQTQLTQLQALVRALPEMSGTITVEQISQTGTNCALFEAGGWIATVDGESVAKALKSLLRYRATLDATTPAPDTSIIGKCEPPSQWDPNAQVRGDIS